MKKIKYEIIIECTDVNKPYSIRCDEELIREILPIIITYNRFIRNIKVTDIKIKH